jgi:2,3-bisphosphoglycerate-independent phosphoglycerate mutase
VHASIDDSIFVAKLAADAGHEIVWHFVADGRDVAPKSAAKYIKQIRSEFARELTADTFRFGTLCGRYYAFDRNENWDRTELAFDAIARGRAEFSAPDIETALSDAYARGETDEFIKPTVIGNQESGIRNRDGLLFTNYRADRARQILKIFTGIHTSSFILHPSSLLCFSQYGEGLDEFCPALLPDIPVKNTLGDVLAAAGLSQLRIAETEKYNHVTYFFDAERNVDFPGEEKILIASPDVATFDLKPEMSAREITAALLPELKNFDVVILNFANGDMVGHSGNIRATVRAMETLDKCLARIVPAVLKLGGVMLITADHGNAEKMTARGTPWTAHTTNKVPFIIVRNQEPGTRNQKLRAGGLSNIAPTILKILGIKKPREMTGRSLI